MGMVDGRRHGGGVGDEFEGLVDNLVFTSPHVVSGAIGKSEVGGFEAGVRGRENGCGGVTRLGFNATVCLVPPERPQGAVACRSGRPAHVGISTRRILGIAFAICFMGNVVAMMSDLGYLALLAWEALSPTLITLLLHWRSIRGETAMAKRIQLHFAWLVTLAVVVQSGVESWELYVSTHDAPRGVIWDFYQFIAAIFGGIVFWICFGIGSIFVRGPKVPGVLPNAPVRETRA